MNLPQGFLVGLGAVLLSSPALASQLPPSVTEDLYVTEFSFDRIAVFDSDGNYLRSFTAPGLDGPYGIAFGPGDRIYVACAESDEVVVFNRAEQLDTRFTATELDEPAGLVFNAAGELLVACTGSARICVFDQNGTFLRWFDGPGMTGPNGIALDSAGHIFVTSFAGPVFHFDAAEQFIATFGAPTGMLLAAPAGIARDENDLLYVAGSGSHNIFSFQSDGTFVAEIEHTDLVGPHGLAFDEDGNLFAASLLDDSIVQFDAAGNWMQTLSDPGMHFPRDLALAPPCPPAVSYCTAGISASGCQATLTSTGSASASKSNGFLLRANSVEGNKDGTYFYSTNGRQANAWGNGTSFVCVAPPVKRAAAMNPTGTAGACDGWFVIDLNALWSNYPAKNPGAGALVQAQLWYRDPLNTAFQTTSMSDAVEFLVCP